MGFSVGGHLASTAATHFSNTILMFLQADLRPDLLILLYPVISFSDSLHTWPRTNLLGEKLILKKYGTLQ